MCQKKKCPLPAVNSAGTGRDLYCTYHKIISIAKSNLKLANTSSEVTDRRNKLIKKTEAEWEKAVVAYNNRVSSNYPNGIDPNDAHCQTVSSSDTTSTERKETSKSRESHSKTITRTTDLGDNTVCVEEIKKEIDREVAFKETIKHEEQQKSISSIGAVLEFDIHVLLQSTHMVNFMNYFKDRAAEFPKGMGKPGQPMSPAEFVSKAKSGELWDFRSPNVQHHNHRLAQVAGCNFAGIGLAGVPLKAILEYDIDDTECYFFYKTEYFFNVLLLKAVLQSHTVLQLKNSYASAGLEQDMKDGISIELAGLGEDQEDKHGYPQKPDSPVTTLKITVANHASGPKTYEICIGPASAPVLSILLSGPYGSNKGKQQVFEFMRDDVDEHVLEMSQLGRDISATDVMQQLPPFARPPALLPLIPISDFYNLKQSNLKAYLNFAADHLDDLCPGSNFTYMQLTTMNSSDFKAIAAAAGTSNSLAISPSSSGFSSYPQLSASNRITTLSSSSSSSSYPQLSASNRFTSVFPARSNNKRSAFFSAAAAPPKKKPKLVGGFERPNARPGEWICPQTRKTQAQAMWDLVASKKIKGAKKEMMESLKYMIQKYN